jgi:DNA-binding transcriptional regulator YdaS (Cro superfamily)
MMSDNSPIYKAVQIAGGFTDLAKLIGTTKGVVWAWVDRGRCPPQWATKVEQAVGGQVTARELRPDVFSE